MKMNYSKIKDKLDKLELLNLKPGLFISEYFYSLRNEIDIQIETLLIQIEKDEEEDFKAYSRLNQIKESMLKVLNSNEKECLNKLIDSNNNYQIYKSDIETIRNEIENNLNIEDDDFINKCELVQTIIESETDKLKYVNFFKTIHLSLFAKRENEVKTKKK